jgi:muramoyltetrapeptide carboxypeptidase
MGSARGRSARPFLRRARRLHVLGRRAIDPTRRRFAAAALALAAAGAAPAGAAEPALVKPPRLRRGDLVGLIAPGGAMTDEQIERAVRNIESLGMRVKPGANLRLRRGNYAGMVFQQLDDLHAMVEDREVRAVWGGRGGSGGSAMLPGIRYDLLRRHPKALIGFSDVTALHLAIHRRAGLVTFHGPAGISTFSDYSSEHLRAVLMDPQPTFTIRMAEENRRRAQEQPAYAERVIRPGTATGRLVGGNLAVLSALTGTPYAAEMRGRLVFLEEVGEVPYRINRMLTQLVQGNGLGQAAGVMLGVFSRCEAPPGEASLTLAETVTDQLGALPTPSVYGFSFGHIAHHFTIPLGVRARLDTEARTVTLLEPAVA